MSNVLEGSFLSVDDSELEALPDLPVERDCSIAPASSTIAWHSLSKLGPVSEARIEHERWLAFSILDFVMSSAFMAGIACDR